MPPGTRQRDLAELVGIHVELLGFQVMLARALLHAHLAHAAIDARGLYDRRPFLDFQRERFFDIHILTCVQRVDGDGRMPVIGHPDQHRVQGLQVQQLTVIRECLRAGRNLLRLVQLRRIDIA